MRLTCHIVQVDESSIFAAHDTQTSSCEHARTCKAIGFVWTMAPVSCLFGSRFRGGEPLHIPEHRPPFWTSTRKMRADYCDIGALYWLVILGTRTLELFDRRNEDTVPSQIACSQKVMLKVMGEVMGDMFVPCELSFRLILYSYSYLPQAHLVLRSSLAFSSSSTALPSLSVPKCVKLSPPKKGIRS